MPNTSLRMMRMTISACAYWSWHGHHNVLSDVAYGKTRCASGCNDNAVVAPQTIVGSTQAAIGMRWFILGLMAFPSAWRVLDR
jgi:hypothetical protein